MRLTKANVARYELPSGKTEALLFDDDLPGFGLRVRSGGKRTWIAQYRLGAKQRRVTLGTTGTIEPDEARKRAREALAKVSLGADPQTEKKAAKEQASVTFAAVVPRYLRFAQPRQSAAYHADVKRYLEQHWRPLGEVALAAISRSQIAMRLGEISQANGAHAANRARAAVSALFSWAVGEGLVNGSPVVGTHKPAEEVRRDRVLSNQELVLIWRHAGSGDFGTIVRLLILTGQRREEVGGMSWDEVQGDLWRIEAGRAKNGIAHDVPLPSSAVALLAARPRLAGRELVFGAKAGPFQGWSNSKERLDAAIVKAMPPKRGTAVKFTPWRLHDIRRTVATRMADLGVLPHVVEAVLNHVSGHKAGVAGIYNRATYAAEKRAALELWGAHVAKLVEASNG